MIRILKQIFLLAEIILLAVASIEQQEKVVWVHTGT